MRGEGAPLPVFGFLVETKTGSPPTTQDGMMEGRLLFHLTCPPQIEG